MHHRVCNWSNTTDATSGTVTAYPIGAPEFTPVLSAVGVDRFLVFYVMFCISLFVPSSVIFWALSCLSIRLRDFDNPFGIFKLYLDIFVLEAVQYRQK